MQQLDIIKTIKILEKNKLPFSKSNIVKTKEQAIKTAKKIGFPVALKITSSKIIHKTDVNGVEINLETEDQVDKAYDHILKKNKKVKIDGFLVQKMETGTEIIIGMKKDPQFGPIIMFGLGGIFTEILKDVSLRITPIDKNQAVDMIKEIKAHPILEGSRGRKAVNINALVDILLKTSQLSQNKNILELDFNPVIVDDKSATIVDARIMVE